MSAKRTDIVVPANIDQQTRMVFLQLIARVSELEAKAATIDQLLAAGVIRREGGRIVAVVQPAK